MGWHDVRDGNRVRAELSNGRVVVGAFVRISAPEAVELCGHSGCDFVLIDLEHSSMSWQQISALIVAAEAAGTTPIARVSNPTRDLITRVLDIGAHGVMVAQVDTAETAAAVVAATRYGPDGTRGVAGGRGSGWGLKMSAAEYQEAANRATFVSVQIETRYGVDHVEEIAAVDGLDCVFVGLSDLTTDLGIAGQFDHPELGRALDQIHQACDHRGVAVGYPATGPEMARSLFARGARFIATADTTQLARAMSAFVSEVSEFDE